jgi:hypothetical protein
MVCRVRILFRFVPIYLIGPLISCLVLGAVSVTAVSFLSSSLFEDGCLFSPFIVFFLFADML